MADETGAGATPSPSQSEAGTGATPIPTSLGTVVVPNTPPGTGATPSPEPSTADGHTRDAEADADREAESQRDAGLSAEEAQRALTASRQAERRAQRELKRYQDAEKAREDASKTELQRAIERAEAAEAKSSALERQIGAQTVAAEFGITQWADELQGDPDTRTMRAHAQRIRERLGMDNPAGPGMDGGVRALGAPLQPSSMDDLIRGRARR